MSWRPNASPPPHLCLLPLPLVVGEIRERTKGDSFEQLVGVASCALPSLDRTPNDEGPVLDIEAQSRPSDSEVSVVGEEPILGGISSVARREAHVAAVVDGCRSAEAQVGGWARLVELKVELPTGEGAEPDRGIEVGMIAREFVASTLATLVSA